MEMIYLQSQSPERLIPRMISVCFTMPRPRGRMCVHILSALWRVALNIVCFSFSVLRQLLRYSTFIHHPFVCSLVGQTFPSSLIVCSSSIFFHNFLPHRTDLSQRLYIRLHTPPCSLMISRQGFSSLKARCVYSVS